MIRMLCLGVCVLSLWGCAAKAIEPMTVASKTKVVKGLEYVPDSAFFGNAVLVESSAIDSASLDREPSIATPVKGSGYGWLSWEEDFDFEVYYQHIADKFQSLSPEEIPFATKEMDTLNGENIYEFAKRVTDEIDPVHLAVALLLSNADVDEQLFTKDMRGGISLQLPTIRQLDDAREDYEQVVLKTKLHGMFGKGGVKIINASATHEVVDSEWVTAQSDGYLVQFVSTTEFAELAQWVSVIDDGKPLVVYAFKRSSETGRPFYGLARSSVYKTTGQALNAVRKLPKSVRTAKPWVRSIRRLKNEIDSLQGVNANLADRLVALSSGVDSLANHSRENDKSGVYAVVDSTEVGSETDKNTRVAEDKTKDPMAPLDALALMAEEGSYTRGEVVWEEISSNQRDFRNPGAPQKVEPQASVDNWQRSTSVEQSSQTVDRSGDYYVGAVSELSNFTETLDANMEELDPLNRKIEWNFRGETKVGTAIKNVADFIGYELVVSDEKVNQVYKRRIPVPHRNIVNVSAEESMMVLGGAGLLTVFDHANRTVSHMQKKQYTMAGLMEEGTEIDSCPLDISSAIVLNGVGGNVFMLKDGTTCAY